VGSVGRLIRLNIKENYADFVVWPRSVLNRSDAPIAPLFATNKQNKSPIFQAAGG
jgi:hypothetical protein